MTQLVFFIAAIGAIAAPIGVIALRNPFYGVLSLVGHLLCLAALFLLLRAEFLAASQVIVYAGGVMVLYVFVVAYVGGTEESLGASRGWLRVLTPIFAGVLMIELVIASLGSGLKAITTKGADISPTFGSPAEIGQALLTRFLFPFEVASLLLLVAAVGAVGLARRRDGYTVGSIPLKAGAIPSVPPKGTGTMAEAAGDKPMTGLSGGDS